MRVKLTITALIAAIPTVAQAQVTCGATGVDLAVGNLTTISVFTNTGGTVTIMPGIDLCNVGSSAADWSGATAAHPAVVFTLLRYDAVGAFEAIGQSWAHHQSSALQQSLCCACTPAGIAQLGVGCSTQSSASAVAQQTSLGLRGAIDPQTGILDWPLVSPPLASTADRRLHVALADLATPGARYFLEAQIVAADDATSANRANNASFREVLVTATPTFAFTGTTTRGSPAIEVWPTVDPNASVATVAVPGEGGILRLGSSVRDLGDGFHAYEFALHDLDSLAGVRSFSVPISAGLILRNIEFRGVATHSGDPVDDTDWTATQSGGMLTWSTADYTTNPLANGLRFGTTFRFRFEANSAPTSGSIELARFRPGAPDSWLVAAPIPGITVGNGPYCLGDSTGAPCPCSNYSPIGLNAGCLNSLGQGGRVGQGGLASISADSLTLLGGGMPSSSALYFQGTSTLAAGAGVAFGDGLRCVGGNVLRLGTYQNVGGLSSHPSMGATPISIASGVVPGDTRYFQIWYRNAAAFCTASTFNLSNGLAVTWAP